MGDAAVSGTQQPALPVVGRVLDHQRSWFARLCEDVAAGGPLVLAGSLVPHEIFDAFDLPCIIPTNYAGMLAQLDGVEPCLDGLLDRGYHRGLLGGALAPVVGACIGPDHPSVTPWGLPKPTLIVTGPDDATEVIARELAIPYVAVQRPHDQAPYPSFYDMGHWAWEDLEKTNRLDTLVVQYRSVIAACEQATGKQLDLDRLRELITMSNLLQGYYDDIRRIICTSPKMPVDLVDIENTYWILQFHRGTQWALDETRAMRDEIRARVERAQWICPDERIRLSYEGVLAGKPDDFYSWFLESHGAVFVRSYPSYLCLAADGYVRHGTADPLRNLAARYASFTHRSANPPSAGNWQVRESRAHRLSGAVYVRDRVGTKFMINAMESAGYPVLQAQAAVEDGRWNETKIRKLVGDFIETRLAGAES